MENKKNIIEVEISSMSLGIFVGAIVGLAAYGAYVLTAKIAESFE
jgi:hypothetical protein